MGAVGPCEGGLPGHLWDQQKRYLCQMHEARVGRHRVSSLLCIQLLPLSDSHEEHLIIHDKALYPLVSKGTVIRFQATSRLEASAPSLRWKNSSTFWSRLNWALSSLGLTVRGSQGPCIFLFIHLLAHLFIHSFFQPANIG